MKTPTLKELFDAGVHFGHQKYRSAAQARQYVFQVRDGVMIFDLEKTAEALKRAFDTIASEVAHGKKPLLVGTKRQAQDLVLGIAQEFNLPYVVSRWPGGMLTNFETLKQQIKKYNQLLEDVTSEQFAARPKKERLIIERRIAKMGRVFAGLRALDTLPDFLIVLGATQDKTAIAEARTLGIKTVALTDSDTNPELVDYPIPANDDARQSVELVANVIKQAIAEGVAKLKKSEQSSKKKQTNDRADQKVKK